MVVENVQTIYWSFAVLVLNYCAWEVENALLYDNPFHCVVDGLETHVFHLVLGSEHANTAREIHSACFLVIAAWIFDGFYFDSETFAA